MAKTYSKHSVVAALAGRRIDACDAVTEDFPMSRVPLVRARIAQTIKFEDIGLLVCSAACGADLLALDVAAELGVRCRVILPYDSSKFRHTSVIDRPGNWGPIYDRIIRDVAAQGNLIVLGGDVGDSEVYSLANEAIVREASIAASPKHAIAIAIWEGQPRKGRDATADFCQIAQKEGMSLRTVLTCGN